MVELFNARKSVRVSSLLRLLRAGDSMEEIVLRRANLWLRKHALSLAFHQIKTQNDIHDHNMLIGAVQWGWSQLLRLIVFCSFLFLFVRGAMQREVAASKVQE